MDNTSFFNVRFKIDNTDEKKSAIRMLKADDAYEALWEIAQEIFRPHRKHGYPDGKLQEIIENDYNDEDEGVLEAISILEEKFYDILEENGINFEKEWN